MNNGATPPSIEELGRRKVALYDRVFDLTEFVGNDQNRIRYATPPLPPAVLAKPVQCAGVDTWWPMLLWDARADRPPVHWFHGADFDVQQLQKALGALQICPASKKAGDGHPRVRLQRGHRLDCGLFHGSSRPCENVHPFVTTQGTPCFAGEMGNNRCIPEPWPAELRGRSGLPTLAGCGKWHRKQTGVAGLGVAGQEEIYYHWLYASPSPCTKAEFREGSLFTVRAPRRERCERDRCLHLHVGRQPSWTQQLPLPSMEEVHRCVASSAKNEAEKYHWVGDRQPEQIGSSLLPYEHFDLDKNVVLALDWEALHPEPPARAGPSRSKAPKIEAQATLAQALLTWRVERSPEGDRGGAQQGDLVMGGMQDLQFGKVEALVFQNGFVVAEILDLVQSFMEIGRRVHCVLESPQSEPTQQWASGSATGGPPSRRDTVQPHMLPSSVRRKDPVEVQKLLIQDSGLGFVGRLTQIRVNPYVRAGAAMVGVCPVGPFELWVEVTEFVSNKLRELKQRNRALPQGERGNHLYCICGASCCMPRVTVSCFFSASGMYPLNLRSSTWPFPCPCRRSRRPAR